MNYSDCARRPWVLVPQITRNDPALVKTGHVIVVGRGAPLVTAKSPVCFRCRAGRFAAYRTERVKSVFSLNTNDALKYIRKEDRGARRYTQANFHASIDDDLLYHMVINTDRIPYGEVAQLIAVEARKSFERDENLRAKIGD